MYRERALQTKTKGGPDGPPFLHEFKLVRSYRRLRSTKVASQFSSARRERE